MTDEKYDVFGDHLAGGVKWRYRQDRGQFYTKASGGLSPYAPQRTANRCY